jgi:hypothetical protein
MLNHYRLLQPSRNAATTKEVLYTQLVKKNEMYPSLLPKAELRGAVLRRCHAVTRISRAGTGDLVALRKGGPPLVTASVEKRQGHKITRVVGMEAYMVRLRVCRQEACVHLRPDTPRVLSMPAGKYLLVALAFLTKAHTATSTDRG